EAWRHQELRACGDRDLQLVRVADGAGADQCFGPRSAQSIDGGGGAAQRERDLDGPEARIDRAGSRGHGEIEIVEADDADEPRRDESIGAHRPTSRPSRASSAVTSAASNRNGPPPR